MDKIAHLKDDDLIVFAGFGESGGDSKYAWDWRLLNLTIQRPEDPANVISLSLSYSGIRADTLQEMAAIAADLTRQVREG